jgi:hypothetical protein
MLCEQECAGEVIDKSPDFRLWHLADMGNLPDVRRQ